MEREIGKGFLTATIKRECDSFLKQESGKDERAWSDDSSIAPWKNCCFVYAIDETASALRSFLPS